MYIVHVLIFYVYSTCFNLCVSVTCSINTKYYPSTSESDVVSMYYEAGGCGGASNRKMHNNSKRFTNSHIEAALI